MKINREPIKDLFRSQVADRTGPDRDFCPQPEEIVDSLRGRMSQTEKEKFVEHLSRCSLCIEEFHFFLEMKRVEERFIQAVKNQKKESRIFDTPLKGISKLLRPKEWKPIPVAAAVFLILVFASTLYISQLNRQKNRGEKPSLFKLIQPVHAKRASLPPVFRWSEARGAEYYVLELFDATLLPVWRSRPLFDHRFQLPADVSRKLSPGQTYFWFVTAFFPSDKKIESPLEQFRVK
jgi:hypothetical protein